MELAALCHRRVKTSRETVAKALQGDYRREHVFALKQSLDNETIFAKWEESASRQAEVRLWKQAAKLGFQVMPKEASSEA